MLTYTRLGLIGLLCLLGLIALAVLAPPDGQERGELAQFFGGLHPLAVHLPIALLLLVPVMEIAGQSPRREPLRASAGFVLGLGVLSAVATPYLGWLLAWSGGFEGGFVTQHMWGGILVAAATLFCWMFRRRVYGKPSASVKRGLGHGLPSLYLGMLAITVLVVGFTGYRGGQLAHGEDHLIEHLPPALRAWIGIPAVQRMGAHDREATFYSARIAPIFEDHCLLCHGANKRKGDLRLDSYEGLVRGGENGVVITAGNAKGSELFRRVSLDPSDEDVMPADGKPPLGDDDRTLLELWINAGASQIVAIDAIAGAPPVRKPEEPLAPDYRAEQDTIAQLASALNIRLVPRSQNPTDGLILRTASSPAACNDATLANLAPVARYIVDAELARTKVTDAGLQAVAEFTNLRALDLSHTSVTSDGLIELASLSKLEVVNLTDTSVDDKGLDSLRKIPSIKRLYVFQTKVTS